MMREAPSVRRGELVTPDKQQQPQQIPVWGARVLLPPRSLSLHRFSFLSLSPPWLDSKAQGGGR